VVAERLRAVLDRVCAAAGRAGRDAAEVTLVAVSKGQPVAAIAEAYAAGHRDFGENRADELLAKVPQLPDDIRWHFVGALQSRKAKLVRPHTWLLHSLDRPSLVRAWARDTDAPPPVLAEVNIAREPQKHGAVPDELGELLGAADAAGISCRGLMIIPPQPETAEDSRRWFADLVTLQQAWVRRYPSLVELSMGMTDDFEVAVEEGATVIRVGRAIFGPRQ
jgi:PLP dependent protein